MKQIKLSRNKIAIVSDEDFKMVNQHKWYCVPKDNCEYACHDFGNKDNQYGVKHVTMHKFLMDTPFGMQVDHIDGNGLNNCRENLRICTQSQNNGNYRISARNKSGFKGVSWHKKTGKWRATLATYMLDKKQQYLGVFENKEDAAKAYNEAAKVYFGEFARLNKI